MVTNNSVLSRIATPKLKQFLRKSGCEIVEGVISDVVEQGVYILFFPEGSGSLYVGQTNNIERRIKEHVRKNMDTTVNFIAKIVIPDKTQAGEAASIIRRFFEQSILQMIREENTVTNRIRAQAKEKWKKLLSKYEDGSIICK